MCWYGLPGAIVSDNGTQFSSIVVIDFCKDLEVQRKYVFVVHPPQANGKAKSTNKVILKGLEKKLDDVKGLQAELLHEILWSYHTTLQSITKQNLFSMVHTINLTARPPTT